VHLSPRRSRARSKTIKEQLKDKALEKEKKHEHEQENKKGDGEKEKEPKATPQKEQEKEAEGEAQNVKKELLSAEKAKELPKLPILKVVLRPNAHAMVVIPADAVSSSSIGQLESEAVPSLKPEMPEFKHITQRRKSMMPVSSQHLVDKHELFGSLDYEDFVEQQREQGRRSNVGETTHENVNRVNRNLANMFERSNDNCSISTHNILAGKRRSRLNASTLNETQLYKNVLKTATGEIEKTTGAKPKAATKKVLATAEAAKTDEAPQCSSAPLADATLKRKRGRPPGSHRQPPQKRRRELSNDNGIRKEKDATDDALLIFIIVRKNHQKNIEKQQFVKIRKTTMKNKTRKNKTKPEKTKKKQEN